MSEQLALLPEYLTAHLQLTLVALLAGVVVSVPLGVLVTRVRWAEQLLLGLASIIQTIPGLALLAIMVPVLAALALPSIGYLPAALALFLYSMLPMLRNTVTGLGSVSPAYKEAAQGVGMTPGQQLRLVELPIAAPVIVAGIRTSTVWTVGMATLSTPVGAPSLGNYIFSGLQTRNYVSVSVGCVSAAVLALSLDGLVRSLEYGVRRRSRRGIMIPLLLALGLVLYAGGSLVAEATRSRDTDVRIGAKTFTEQYILSEILARQIRRTTPTQAQVVPSLGSTVAFDALRAGEIDLYVDYTGTLWSTILRRDGRPENRARVLSEVTRYLRETAGVSVVVALGFENTYALGMRRSQAQALGIRTISDLARHARDFTLGTDYEFLARPEWRHLQEVYGMAFSRSRSMDPSLMYQAVSNGNVDVITAFSTDGRVEALDLYLLEDDRGAIPPYDAVVLMNGKTAADHPRIVDAVRRLEGTISVELMRAMNLAVDEQGQTPAMVADTFVGKAH